MSNFEIVSSHPNVLAVLDSKIAIKGAHREHIRLKIPHRERPGIAEVMVFVQDEDEKIFDSIMFRITYTK